MPRNYNTSTLWHSIFYADLYYCCAVAVVNCYYYHRYYYYYLIFFSFMFRHNLCNLYCAIFFVGNKVTQLLTYCCKRVYLWNSHCVKSVCIRSFSGPCLPTFGLNTDQKNSEYGHFSRSVSDEKLLEK